VPYEAAARLSPAQRLAYLALLIELRGGRFDWSAFARPRK